MTQNVTLEKLRQLVEREAVAIPGRALLEPAGGPANEKRAGAKYSFGKRRNKRTEVDCVLIDSVQSQEAKPIDPTKPLSQESRKVGEERESRQAERNQPQ